MRSSCRSEDLSWSNNLSRSKKHMLSANVSRSFSERYYSLSSYSGYSRSSKYSSDLFGDYNSSQRYNAWDSMNRQIQRLESLQRIEVKD